LPALASVAVAFAGDSFKPIPERYLTAKGLIEGWTRIYLVHGVLQGHSQARQPHVNDLMVLQQDWSNRIHDEAWKYVAKGATRHGADAIKKAQKAIDQMDGAPLASVAKGLATQSASIEVAWDGKSIEPGILLLRGYTSEFYRPFRQALREALTREAGIRLFFEAIRPAFSIWPADFELSRIVAEAVSDPVNTYLAIAKFADQARVLEIVMAAACDLAPDNEKLKRVHQAFVKWDRAICGGHQSRWLSM